MYVILHENVIQYSSYLSQFCGYILFVFFSIV